LAREQQAYEQAQTQLQDLTDYQKGYIEHLKSPSQITPSQIHTFYAFLNKVNQAILAQEAQLETAERNLNQARAHWREKKAYHQALEKLLQKRQKQAQQQRDKQEQKMLDELASQAGSRQY